MMDYQAGQHFNSMKYFIKNVSQKSQLYIEICVVFIIHRNNIKTTDSPSKSVCSKKLVDKPKWLSSNVVFYLLLLLWLWLLTLNCCLRFSNPHNHQVQLMLILNLFILATKGGSHDLFISLPY